MPTPRFVNDGMLEIAGEDIVIANHEVGFGSYVNAHRLHHLDSLGIGPDGVGGELEIVGDAFNANAITGLAGPAVILNHVGLKSIAVSGGGLRLIAEKNAGAGISTDRVIDK
jgi:hypothetical protein